MASKPDLPTPSRRLLTFMALALLLIVVAAPRGGNEPEPLVAHVSDVIALAEDTDVIERAEIDDQGTRVYLHLTDNVDLDDLDDTPTDAEVRAAVRDAKDTDEPVRVAAVDDDVERPEIVAEYPIGYGRDLIDRFVDAGVRVETLDYVAPSALSWLIPTLLPVLAIGLIIFFVLSKAGGGVGGIGKLDKRRGSAVDVPDTRFSDIAGIPEVVDELEELVAFLKNPKMFETSGARVSRGVLLEGPPGTGKTQLARAVAGEAGVPFFALSGSDFVETFVGVGAARVRELFRNAAKHPGGAIVFIDEIDSVGKARAPGASTGANDERENTLNAMLSEMDGFTKHNVVVIAATNRSDILDPALTRPGRFDRRIAVPNPDKGGREAILKLHAKGKTIDPVIDFGSLARRSVGMSGADLESLVNEAALASARRGSDRIEARDFDEALATIMMGRERRSASVTDSDRVITAWHEAGHALAALLQSAASSPVSVSIVPRGPAGGVTWMDGVDDNFLTRSRAQAQLVTALAGRAAEMILLEGDYTTGASSDLRAATDLANRMVTEFGMAGTLACRSGERIIGEEALQINAVVEDMLQEALATATATITTAPGLLETVAEALLEEETIDVVRLRELCEANGVEVPPLPERS